MPSPRGLIVFGASGHAKVVIDAIEQQRAHRVIFVADDNPRLKGQELLGYAVIGGRNDLPDAARRRRVRCGFVAIGDNRARSSVARWFIDTGFELAVVVHPAARIARGVTIAPGAVVMAGAVINIDSTLGEGAIINTGATIDHDCVIGAFAHVAPGAAICGGVRIGEGTLVGAGAAITPGVAIGRNAIVGAGATVIADVPDGACVVGTPAKSAA